MFSAERSCWKVSGFPGRSMIAELWMFISGAFARRSKRILPGLAGCLHEEVKDIFWLIP
jgi:hypothetical protein